MPQTMTPKQRRTEKALRAADSLLEPAEARERWKDHPSAGFRHPGEYFDAVKYAAGGVMDPRLAALGDEHNTFNDGQGGFLVPTGIITPPRWTLGAVKRDPLADAVTQVKMPHPVATIPARCDKDHSTSTTGGLVARTRAEGDTVPPTRLKVDALRLTANSVWVTSFATHELVQDSWESLAQVLFQCFLDECMNYRLDKRINGTGVGEPQGILAGPATLEIAKEGGQAADTIVGDNVRQMARRTWAYDSAAVWLANPECLDQLGDTGLLSDPVSEDGPMRLLHRPLFLTEFARALGDRGDLMTIVPSEYVEGVLQAEEWMYSIYARWQQNTGAFKFYWRGDGMPWWRSPLTPRYGSQTLSAYTVLGARD